MAEPAGPMFRLEPTPDAVITAVQELSSACIKWEPVPMDRAMSDPPLFLSEHASLCAHALHGDQTIVAMSLGLILGAAIWALLLRPAIGALWRSLTRAVRYTVRRFSAAPTR